MCSMVPDCTRDKYSTYFHQPDINWSKTTLVYCGNYISSVATDEQYPPNITFTTAPGYSMYDSVLHHEFPLVWRWFPSKILLIIEATRSQETPRRPFSTHQLYQEIERILFTAVAYFKSFVTLRSREVCWLLFHILNSGKRKHPSFICQRPKSKGHLRCHQESRTHYFSGQVPKSI